MGIKDLFKFIQKYYPKSIEYVKLNDCSGKIIAIDSNSLFVPYWSVHCRNYIDANVFRYSENLKEQVEFDDIFIHTMKSILWFIIGLLNHKINLVFIFDGGMEEEKKETCEKRKENREKAKKKIKIVDGLIDDETEKKNKSYLKAICFPSREYMNKCRDILSNLGFPTFLSKTDGEKLCCSLYIEGKVNAVYSGDSDCIPYGCFDFYCQILNSDNIKYFEHYNIIKLLKLMDITYEQLIDICILSGCDYNKRVRGCSPKKSYELIKKYEKLEDISMDIVCSNYIKCREIFGFDKSNIEDDELKMKSCDIGLIDQEYVRRLKFEIETLVNKLNSLKF